MKNKEDEVIAILDSGIGGISILKQLIKKYKAGHYVYFADNLNMPYGNKDKKFVKERVEEIISYLKQEYNVKKIIIACNTASSCIFGTNDKTVELLTFNKENTYLTTDLTRKNLIGYNAISANNLASIIENNIFKKRHLSKIIKEYVLKKELDKVDKLVLGCTHYELVADLFQKHCPHTKIEINSSNLINNLNIQSVGEIKVTIIMSDKSKYYKNKLIKLLYL